MSAKPDFDAWLRKADIETFARRRAWRIIDRLIPASPVVSPSPYPAGLTGSDFMRWSMERKSRAYLYDQIMPRLRAKVARKLDGAVSW